MENELDGVNTPETQDTSRKQLIYIGPNIPGGALHRFQVFRGGIPVHLGDLPEKCPAIQSLFVPVEELSVHLQALAVPGTAPNTLYRIVADYLKGGK